MRCILAICCVCGAYQQLVVNVINRLILFLESLLYEFHEQRRDSYLSPESVRRSLGTPTCPRFPVLQEDRDRLRELATYGMVVSEPPGFHPCPSRPDFRRSYLEVSSTVDKILFSMRCIPANCCVCGAYQQLVVNVISRLILLLATCRDNGLLCKLCMLMRELVFCRVGYHCILLCLWCMLTTCAAC